MRRMAGCFKKKKKKKTVKKTVRVRVCNAFVNKTDARSCYTSAGKLKNAKKNPSGCVIAQTAFGLPSCFPCLFDLCLR